VCGKGGREGGRERRERREGVRERRTGRAEGGRREGDLGNAV
jgi:hypothetical protein